MKDDWGIQYPHEFQICAIHHIAFQRDQILYLVAKTGSVQQGVGVGEIDKTELSTDFTMVGL
jgi:hypothetical protein